MKVTHPTTALKAIVTAGLTLLIALFLSVPAGAKDIELEPDGFAATTSAVASTAPSAGADSAGSAPAPQAAAAHGSASHSEQRPAPQDAQGLTLSSFLDWLWSLPIFCGSIFGG